MAYFSFIVQITVTLWVIAPVRWVAGYSPCTSLSQQFQGYTYTLEPETRTKVWSHCAFPNPVWDQSFCGRPETTTANYICDPDGLLSSVAIGDEINLKLTDIPTNTICVDSTGDHQTYLVAVVLINRIRLPDIRSQDLCINDCGQLQPELNTTLTNSTTDAEEDAIMENFADGIRALWQLGTCGNDVIIFYCKQLNKMYISVGPKAAKYLKEYKLQSLGETFITYVNEGRLEEGLLYVAEQIRHALRAYLTPAQILLIMGMSIYCLFAALLVYWLFIYDLIQ